MNSKKNINFVMLIILYFGITLDYLSGEIFGNLGPFMRQLFVIVSILYFIISFFLKLIRGDIKKLSFKNDKLVLLWLLFSISVLISSLLRKDLNRNILYLIFLTFPVYVIMIPSVLENPKNTILKSVFISSFLLLCFSSIISPVSSFTFYKGIFSNSNHMGFVSLQTSISSLMLLLKDIKVNFNRIDIKSLRFLPFLLISSFFVIVSGSRTSLLSLVVVIGFIVPMFFYSIGVSIKKTLFYLALFSIAFIIIFKDLINAVFLKKLLYLIKTNNITNNRTALWKTLIISTPFLGKGYSYVLGGAHAHNLVLHIFSVHGYIPSIIFSLFLAYSFYETIKYTKNKFGEDLFFIPILAVVSFFIIGLFDLVFNPVGTTNSLLFFNSLGLIILEKGNISKVKLKNNNNKNKNKGKKVLHILNSNKYSGAENVAITIIKNLSPEYQSYYCSPTGNIVKKLEKENVEYLPMKNKKIKSIKDLIDKFNPDIIHAHDFTVSIIVAAINPNCKVICHIHQNPLWLKKINIKTIVFTLFSINIDKILVVSDSIKDDFVFSKIILNKMFVIYNPINSDKIIKLSKEDIIMEKFDVVYLGRLVEAKNIEYLLAIYKELIFDNKDLKIAIIGEGEKEKVIKDFIAKYDFEKNFTLFGKMNNPFPILLKSKIMIMTSKWEGFGLAAAEAMVLGTPVLSLPTGGLKNVVGFTNGLLCNDIEEFVTKSKRLFGDSAYYVCMSKKVKIDIKEKYNFDKYIDNIKKVYS